MLSFPQDIPAFVTHVYEVDNMRCSRKFPLQEYRAQETITARRAAINNRHIELPVLPEGNGEICTAEEIVRLENVSIRYGSRTIIDRLNWTVKNGEKWSLSGPNGAGKSTLLSLICADNPQAYSQNITLFDHKRGSGESIWDIKKHIGYVSPEIHRSYLKDIPAAEIVASGYYDTIGLFRRLTPQQIESCGLARCIRHLGSSRSLFREIIFGRTTPVATRPRTSKRPCPAYSRRTLARPRHSQ